MHSPSQVLFVQTDARVAAMLELFNTLALPEAKLDILQRALAYARATRCSKLAPSLVGKAEVWERQWQLRREEAAPLFADIAAVLAAHPSPVLRKEAFMLRSKVLLPAATCLLCECSSACDVGDGAFRAPKP